MRNDWYGVVLAAGIVLLFFSWKNYSETLPLIKNGMRVKATVVRLERGEDSDGDAGYAPVFSFLTKDGEIVEFGHNVASNPPAWSVGEETVAIYDPAQPEDARALRFFSVFPGTIVLMIFAMPLIVLGGGYYITRLLIGARGAHYK